MSDNKHWANKYIGKPYKLGGQYDCWTLFREIQKVEFNRDVPVVNVEGYSLQGIVKTFRESTDETIGNWKKINFQDVKEGSAILLAQMKETHHIGIWINQDSGGIIHCVEKIGVVFTTDDKIRASRWRIVGAYDYVV